MRFLFQLLFGLGTLAATAQCSITSFSAANSCIQPWTTAQVTLAGGQPPYSLVFTAGNGSTQQLQSNLQGAQSFTLNSTVIWAAPMTLTVTDAQGCTTSAVNYSHVYWYATPQIQITYTCNGGAELRWNTSFQSAYGQVPVPFCAPFQYHLSNGQGVQLGIGTLATFNGWVFEGGSTWRFGQSLVPGNYSLQIYSDQPDCPGSYHHYCFTATHFIIPPPSTTAASGIALRALLRGPTNSGSTMSDALRTANLIPLTEPYSAMGYTYVGQPSGLSIPASVLATTGSNAIADWVVVEWRNPAQPTEILYSKPALLERDGDVQEVTGGNVLGSPLPIGPYHMSIRHRNHLGVMTATPIEACLMPQVNRVDWRLGNAHGTQPLLQMGNYWYMVPGDVNFDGTVRYTGSQNDRDPLLQAIGGVIPTSEVNNVYSPLDVNMDGRVRYTGSSNDRDRVLQAIGGVIPTQTRVQQLP